MINERKAIAGVDALYEAEKDTLTMDDWRRLIRHPEDPGIMWDEGAEFSLYLQQEEDPVTSRSPMTNRFLPITHSKV